MVEADYRVFTGTCLDGPMKGQQVSQPRPYFQFHEEPQFIAVAPTIDIGPPPAIDPVDVQQYLWHEDGWRLDPRRVRGIREGVVRIIR